MSIKTKVKKIVIDEEEYFLSFTMDSMHEYKERYNKSALSDLATLQDGDIDEEVLFRLFSVCLRKGDDFKVIVPLEEVDEFNPLAVITNYTEDVIDVCFGSLPKPKKGQTPKKNKVKK